MARGLTCPDCDEALRPADGKLDDPTPRHGMTYLCDACGARFEVDGASWLRPLD